MGNRCPPYWGWPAAMASEYVHLSTLGCEITFKFTHPRAADQARQLFGPLLSKPWSTPDFILFCHWHELTKHLIRTRTDGENQALAGFEVYSSEFPDGTPWKSASPPFPPIELVPLAGRFIRLHGAAVSDMSARVLVILGESGFGKTTLSSELCMEHGYRLLADEDVFLYRRSSVVEPFTNGDGPWAAGTNGARALWTRCPELVSSTPAVVSAILALRPIQDGADMPRETTSGELLRELLHSQRPGGSAHEEGIATLTRLARSTPGFKISGQNYKTLRKIAGQVAVLPK